MFYYTQNEDLYIENAASYIISGIEDEGNIVFIENDRLFPLIYEKASEILSPSELERIQHINSFDFYWSTGSFDTESIVAYFAKILEPYFANQIPVRTWAHVEWGQMQDISDTIVSFEAAAHESVISMNLLSVCAYDADRLPHRLKGLLCEYHTHLITDDEIKEL